MRQALGSRMTHVWRWVRTTHVLVRVVSISAVLCVSLAVLTRTDVPPEHVAAHQIGQRLPATALPVLRDGQLLAPQPLAVTAGRLTLLLFTFSLCAHCPDAVRNVQHLAGASSGTRTEAGAASAAPVALFVDSPAEGAAVAAAYAQRLGLSPMTPFYLDKGGVLAAQLGIAAYPAIVLLDRRGIVRDVWIGESSAATLQAASAALGSAGSS